MKKLLTLILTTALLLTACSEQVPLSEDEQRQAPETTAAAETSAETTIDLQWQIATEPSPANEPGFEYELVDMGIFSIKIIDGWDFELDEDGNGLHAWYDFGYTENADLEVKTTPRDYFVEFDPDNFTDVDSDEFLEITGRILNVINPDVRYGFIGINGERVLRANHQFDDIGYIYYYFIDDENLYTVSISLNFPNSDWNDITERVFNELEIMVQTFTFNLDAADAVQKNVYMPLSLLNYHADEDGDVYLLVDDWGGCDNELYERYFFDSWRSILAPDLLPGFWHDHMITDGIYKNGSVIIAVRINGDGKVIYWLDMDNPNVKYSTVIQEISSGKFGVNVNIYTEYDSDVSVGRWQRVHLFR